MINRGSEWHRWEPHIHGPGTVLNNQFSGADPWNDYLTALEACTPSIKALGVTDYYTTDTYEEVAERRAAGRLPNVQLLFPNVEIRLDVAAKTGFVNLHLLVSPEDPDHVAELHRFLGRLQFPAHGDSFNCTKSDLIRLGKAADRTILDDRKALEFGATQFKVNFKTLCDVFRASDWAGRNILIAAAGAEGDGTSGVRAAADLTIRQEIEKFADVIFASSAAQREFWIGKRRVSVEELRQRYRGCKPCMHGSDAHDLASIGKPDGDRYSWIKGALSFDALRQACIDPEGRAYVGTEAPKGATPSQVITAIELQNAAWAGTTHVPLNPGLVAIIGARGSGKTALADVIAAACNAIPDSTWHAEGDISPSFLVRARPLVGDAKAQIHWGEGDASACYLDGRSAALQISVPRARYLSQQFVEELCSSKGASEGLVREIERVIYEAHSELGIDGEAFDFSQLRDNKIERFRRSRTMAVDAIAAASGRIAEEAEKEALVSSLTAQVVAKQKLIANYSADLAKMVIKGSELEGLRLATLNEALHGVTTKINSLAAQRRTFQAMQDEVKNTRISKAPEMLRQVMQRHAGSGLNEQQWGAFLLDFKGDVDTALVGYLAWADSEVAKLTGVVPPAAEADVPLIGPNADLAGVGAAVLRAEISRLEKRISADTVIRTQITSLNKKIGAEKGLLHSLVARLDDAKGAGERRRDLQQEREESYGRLFEAVANEQVALGDLYKPLMEKLAVMPGTLKKLSFRVTRTADVAAWAKYGEDSLIDCRKSGPFFGRGSLEALVRRELLPSWESGSAEQVQSAMAAFVKKQYNAFLEHAPYPPADQAAYRRWLTQFAHWLFSTDHIRVRYEILYDGIEIRKLSPGTRGIVLLLLYLALDDADDRPLIIDQPEENLDPKSVFDELVSLFVAAKSKRQVIMVTHNANLVINTDADQIIVASANPAPGGGLPSFTYASGGLEDLDIRKTVCDILEGGERAFRERARRLRVRLDR